MKRSISAVLLVTLFAAGCAQPHVTRFEYGDIRLDVSGRVTKSKSLAMVDYKPGVYYVPDQVTQQVVIDVKLAEVTLKDQEILGLSWFKGIGALIGATNIKNTTAMKSPPIALGGLVNVGGSVGTGGGGTKCKHGGLLADCEECTAAGGGTGVNIPVIVGSAGRESDKILSVRATFDLGESVDIEESYLAVEIQTGAAKNGKVPIQPMLLPFQLKIEAPESPARRIDTTIAVIRNDQTILISGLPEGENEDDVKKKTPILGKIPLLALDKLFRSADTAMIKRELIIFLTPHIIVDSE